MCNAILGFLRPYAKFGCAEGTEALAAGGVATVAALAALPLVSPLVQIWLLAQKSKEEIEDIVRMKEPLQVSVASEPMHQP